jgi:SAM-dependent methyltransferase
MTTTTTAHWGAEAVDLDEASLPSLKARFVVDRIITTGSVLEIGCGDGKVLRTLARHRPGLELNGCDVRESTQPPDVYAFRRMDRNLPFESGSLDAVLIVDVLEHVPDPRHLIAEAARVLGPGGQLIAFIPIEGERISFYELFRRLLGRDTYAITKEHVQAFTHNEARSLVAERFDIRETRYAYHLLGQFMDAAFFAAARLKRLRDFWWAENVYYNPHMRDAGGGVGALNQVLKVANRVAAFESTALAGMRAGSAGMLLDAARRDAVHERPSSQVDDEGSLRQASSRLSTAMRITPGSARGPRAPLRGAS